MREDRLLVRQNLVLRSVKLFLVGGFLFLALNQGAATAFASDTVGSREWTQWVSSQVSIFTNVAPLEDRLSAGTTGFLRSISKSFRQMRRVLASSLVRWRSWVGGALVFLGLAVVAPAVDRSVIDVWRRDGARAFWRALTAGIAVYVRLIRSGRSPAVGKGLIAFAVVYGVANRDLLPDNAGLVRGFADDLLLIVLASRGFMRMCPDELIEEQAVRVSAARAV